jgi:hypothetical protein
VRIVAREIAAGELVAQPIDNPPLMSVVAIGSVRAQRPAWIVNELTALVRHEIALLVTTGIWPGARMIEPVASR